LPSNSITSGAFLLSGGISINNTTDATSISSGGTLTTAGGVAIAKRLFVGGSASIENTTTVSPVSNNITSSSGALNVSGDVVLTGDTTQSIYFNNAGEGPPSFSPRSPGTKLVLRPTVSSTSTDYAIGVDTTEIWYSTASSVSSHGFYTGEVQKVTINAQGLNLKQLGDAISFFDHTTSTIVSQIYSIVDALELKSQFIEFINASNAKVASIDASGLFTIGLDTEGASDNVGKNINVNSITFTDISSAADSISTNLQFSKFSQSSVAAQNTNVTTTDASTVYIEGAPIVGANQTLTNSYSLFIDSAASTISTTTIIDTAASLYIKDAPLGGSNVINAYALFVQTGLTRLNGGLASTAGIRVPTDMNVFFNNSGSVVSNGDLILNNGISQSIFFSVNGSGIPRALDRSLGSKIILKPSISVSDCDAAFGIETDAIWYSVPNEFQQHKFYTGPDIIPVSVTSAGIILSSPYGQTVSVIRMDTALGTDTKGLVLSGGGGIEQTRGASLTLYGNEFNDGSILLQSGSAAGNIAIQTAIIAMVIENTGEVLIKSETEVDATNAALQVAGGVRVAKSLVVGTELLLDFNQGYVFAGNDTGHLNVSSTVSGLPHRVKHYTSDGDNTDDNTLEIYGLGTTTQITDQEYLRIGYNASLGMYTIKTQFTGSGQSKPLILESGNNTGQLSLLTDGTVLINSSASSSNVSTGALKLVGGIGIDDTTNAVDFSNGGTFTTAGGAAIARDLYVGGKLIVAGAIETGVSTPVIVIGTVTNITEPVEIFSNKMITTGNEKLVSFIARASHIVSNTFATFEFEVPSAADVFATPLEVVINATGYTNDTDPVSVENIAGYVLPGTKNAKIKYTSGSDGIDTIQIILRYSVGSSTL